MNKTEEWHDCDFTGDIRAYPINDSSNDFEDYDERRKGEKTHWTDLS